MNIPSFIDEAGRKLTLAMALVVAMALTGCEMFNLDVDNPDDLEDADLDHPQNVPAMVAGAHGDFAFTMVSPGGGGMISAGAMLTDEQVHAGTWVGLRGLSNGLTQDDWVEAQSRWGEPSSTRFAAEDFVDRIIENDLVDDPSSSPEVAEIAMWAGHANRVMGDTFPVSVFDGGEAEPHTEYYHRALDHFDQAIDVAQAAGEEEIRLAAHGGKAQTYVQLAAFDPGNADQHWSDALQHAGELGDGFVFEQVHSTNSSREENMQRWWGYLRDENTVWGTPFEEWGQQIDDNDGSVVEDGDPRVQWTIRPDVPVGGDGERPFYAQMKYDDYADNIPVVKGTEMRLLEAEYELLQGNYDEMVARINDVRDVHGLDPVTETPDNDDDAWELLMKESGIELWLEGRRLPNFRRWMEVSTHSVGDGIPFRVVREDDENPQYVLEDIEGMFLRVSREEKEANPNLENRPYEVKR